jgi:hypothetical protein
MTEAIKTTAPIRDGWTRWRWVVLLTVAVLGFVLCAILANDHLRGGLSFLAGFALSVVVFAVGIAQVRWVSSYSPTASLLAAMMTYLATVVLFALILAAADPKVLHAGSFALGLVLAVFIWIIEQWRAARPTCEPAP